MKKNETQEEFSKRFVNARRKEKIIMLNKKADELNELTDAFLDAADELLKKETNSDRFFFVEERDFTQKMEDFFNEHSDELLQIEKLNDDEKYMRSLQNVKLVIGMETNSRSEIPLMMIVAFLDNDENDDIFLRMNMLTFDIPKKYINSSNSPLKTINCFAQSEAFKKFMSNQQTFNFISENNLTTMMFEITHPSPKDEILSEFKLDPISDIVFSKDVIVAKNALSAALSVNAVHGNMEEFLREHFKRTYDVTVDEEEISLVNNYEEIYIDITKDPLSVDSTASKKRTKRIVGEVCDEIQKYKFMCAVLHDYFKEITNIGKERGIITIDGSRVNIAIEKFRNELFDMFTVEDEIKKVSSSKIVNIMDEYISTHPETLEFIEPKFSKETENNN